MTPPTTVPDPTPVSAAMIGPAATSGPSPGIAMVPMPIKAPRMPPIAPPVTVPAAAPSGAFVCFSCARSLVPSFSGSRTEISVFRKPACSSPATASSTASRLRKIPNTAKFLPAIKYSFLCPFVVKHETRQLLPGKRKVCTDRHRPPSADQDIHGRWTHKQAVNPVAQLKGPSNLCVGIIRNQEVLDQEV